jgi:hypothetical protein
VPQIDNTSRDGGSDAVPAMVRKSLLARGPEVLWDKAGRVGRLEVMREVIYDMVSTLRVDGMHERREFNSKTQETAASYQQSALLQVPGGISSFQSSERNWKSVILENNFTDYAGAFTLAQLYNDYTHAQADPSYISVLTAEELLAKSLTASGKEKG